MSDEQSTESIKGGAEVLGTLREELATWLEEANDDSQREAYENVLGHVEVMIQEYARRLHVAEGQMSSGAVS